MMNEIEKAEHHAHQQLARNAATKAYMSGKVRANIQGILRHQRPVTQLHKGLLKDNKLTRNSLCPCGSGKKIKKCCLNGSVPVKEKTRAERINEAAELIRAGKVIFPERDMSAEQFNQE